MLSWPIRLAKREIALKFVRRFLAKRCREEWGYTTSGSRPYREYLELSTYARWGDGSVKTAEEQGTGASVGGGQPFLQFMNQSAGNIGTPHLIALGLPRRRRAI